VDISGRHSVKGIYQMVCAAVSARVSPEYIEKIFSVVAESGDLYNLEIWRAKSILGRDFKYPETLAERTAVELAHHISLAGRRLITNGGRS
jgi:hypothetical protein